MKERIKELRKCIGLTQQKFADRLGLKRQTIAAYEIGNIMPSESTLLLICKEFNVNEEWLRTGEGEMFYELTRDAQVAYIIGKTLPNANEYVKDVFTNLGKLSQEFTPHDWEVIAKFIDALKKED